jgi:hypothetical protein
VTAIPAGKVVVKERTNFLRPFLAAFLVR